MRLTPDIVAQADAGLNCLGDRELILRNLGLPAIENLGLARDGYDTIDLTGNLITTVGRGFPLFPRLRTLYLAHNHIQRIESGLASALPNLQTLILTNNRINTLNDLNLAELCKLESLETLSTSANPVSAIANVRQSIVRALPSLKVLNFSKVTKSEREDVSIKDDDAESLRKILRNKRARSSDARDDHNSSNSDTEGDAPEPKKMRTLSPEQMEAVRSLIEQASSVEEITRIQEAIAAGKLTEILLSKKTSKT